MANINENGSFIGRPTADGKKEARELFLWNQDKERKMPNPVFLVLIFEFLFMLLTVSGFGGYHHDSFIYQSLFFIINILLLFYTFRRLFQKLRLDMYTLKTSISISIAAILFIICINIFSDPNYFPQFIAKGAFCFRIVAIILIILSWLTYILHCVLHLT